MTDKSKRVITVVVGTLIGALVSGVLCSPVWYFVNDNFAPSGFMTRVPVLAGIIGGIFGAAGGFLIGLVVTGRRLDKMFAFLAGIIINGLFALTPVILFAANDTPMNILRESYYDAIGQAIIGGIVGLVVSIFAGYMQRRQPQDTTIPAR